MRAPCAQCTLLADTGTLIYGSNRSCVSLITRMQKTLQEYCTGVLSSKFRIFKRYA